MTRFVGLLLLRVAVALHSVSHVGRRSGPQRCAALVQRVVTHAGVPQVPYWPPNSDRHVYMDLYQRLYRDRIMLISDFIDEEKANNIIGGLVYFQNENPNERISLYFNCPGALMKPCLAVYDVLQTLDCEVSTVNMGLASGMGAFLCGAGTKGLRTALPNARFLMQRTGLDDPFMGQATDIANVVRENKRDNDRVEAALAEMTGHSPEKLQRDMKRDFYLSSYEAVQYGLIDQVLIPRDKFLGDYSRTQQYETQQAAGGGGRGRSRGGGGGGGGNPVDQALLNADDTLPQDD
ncbi:Clp protease-domain-containing protein [Pelagophyceae sp. CCMP2097]|nr:Clp protease-domain-containing protein [Pelagophyceae sp. CCMP2097]